MFGRSKRTKDGLYWWCTPCARESQHQRRAADPEHYREMGRSSNAADPYRAFARGTIRDHRRTGCTINFSIDDLVAPARATPDCPICRCALNWDYSKPRRSADDSPTLDRINNNTVLSINDVQVICHSCNRTKSDRTAAEFAEWCRIVGQPAGPMQRDESDAQRKRGWAVSTLGRHRRAGCDVRLSIDELHDLTHESPNCSICSAPLRWTGGHGRIRPDSPTLDRTNNGMVIDTDSVQILCHRCNSSKGPRSMAELLAYCTRVGLAAAC